MIPKLILALIAFLMLPACGERSNAPPPSAASQVAAKNPDPQPMSLGFKPGQFQERFNAIAAARKSEFRITSTQLKPSTDIADNWQYSFTNLVGFLSPVNRADGTIRSFTYIASGDGTVKSGADIMFALGMLIRAIDPALTDDTANQLTFDLVGAIEKKTDVERTRNGIRYGATLIPQVGFLVAVNPVQ